MPSANAFEIWPPRVLKWLVELVLAGAVVALCVAMAQPALVGPSSAGVREARRRAGVGQPERRDRPTSRRDDAERRGPRAETPVPTDSF